MNTSSLFKPFKLKTLSLKNRVVMAPMTRYFSPDGVPTTDVAKYYQARAFGDVGLIISEGTVIDRPASSNNPNVPHFYGGPALEGWQHVISAVHGEGGAMAPQLWHMGIEGNDPSGWLPSLPFEGPSGLNKHGDLTGVSMTKKDIEDTILAFGQAALNAKKLGFDCVEFHGAHGYLIDQFFWEGTNRRGDAWGGYSIADRNRFAIEVIREVRRQVGEDFVIILRISQFKLTEFTYKKAKTPKQLEEWLAPLADAGVDIFHCSQRRFWEPEYEGSDLNLAGWAKKVTGQPTITVGSIGLSEDFTGAFNGESSTPRSIEGLIQRLDKGEFDLVAVGRPFLSDPNWVVKVKNSRFDELKGFISEDRKRLVF